MVKPDDELRVLEQRLRPSDVHTLSDPTGLFNNVGDGSPAFGVRSQWTTTAAYAGDGIEVMNRKLEYLTEAASPRRLARTARTNDVDPRWRLVAFQDGVESNGGHVASGSSRP